MLGGLALKHRWRNRRRAAGQDTTTPNLVMGANVQVCWEKFCRYFDVEARLVDVGPETTHLTPDGAAERCDDNTIGVVAVLGSTYDGTYEDVAGIAGALDTLHATRDVNVPIHVDGASGAMVAPFLDPDLDWDFRIRRVQSINCSGHKYGLVYPGVGWIVWRDHAALPDELVFDVDYLGGTMPTFGLNFSRPGAQVAAQYYSFLRLGIDGYRRVHQTSRDTARWLADQIEPLGPFRLISRGEGIPAFAFTTTAEADFDVYDVSERLRTRGWIVPAYKLPPALDTIDVLRIVVRNGFSRDLAAILLADLRTTIDRLSQKDGREPDRTAFHH